MFKNKYFAIVLVFLLILAGTTSITSVATNQNIGENKNIQTHLKITNYDIIIPIDYTTIQEGIDNAEPYDKILIKSGVYKEHITIDKEGLILQGENKYNTILDGCNTLDDGIFVTSENVIIDGLTIEDFRDDDFLSWAQAGIKIYSSNVVVNNTILHTNRIGIEIYSGAYNATVTNNELINDGIGLGNYFKSSEYPNITQKDFLHNIVNNTVNGRPMYYYTNKDDFAIPYDAGQIILVNCTNFTIRDLYMSNNDFSVIVAYCYNSLIENITITDTDGEVLLYHCENITIQNNTITNTFKAVCLESKSKNNIVRYNDLSGNGVGMSVFIDANNNSIYCNKACNNLVSGVEIVSYHGGTQRYNIISENQISNNKIGIFLKENSVNNIIQNNSISKNRFGIVLQDSSNHNIIKYNNFKSNPIPAVFIRCTSNDWDRNYWNRPRVSPKPIMGLRPLGKIMAPWLNFDMKPALKPYEI